MFNLILKLYLLPLLFILIFSHAYSQGSGGALKLDGFDDYVLFNQDNRGISNEVTVSAWVKTESYKYHWVVGKYNWGGDRGFHLYIREGKAAFAGRDGTTNYRNSGLSTTRVNDGKWHHLTGVFDKGTWQIYVDGILQSELITGNATTTLASSAPLAIGKDYLSNNEQYDGIVDEIRIWKTVLSEAEIRHSMCQKILPTSPDLVGHFTFDEGSGSTVKDHSTLNLNGSFVNMAPSSARVISGAPIGDKSTYLYTSDWQDQQISINGIGETKFSVDSVGANTEGIHIYYVNSKPNFTGGLTSPDQINGYFGVFTPLLPDTRHKLSYKLGPDDCFNSIFEREDNATPQWKELNIKYEVDSFTGIMTKNRGEYVVDEALTQILGIQGVLSFCKGGSTLLTVNTTASVEWNNGSKGNTLIVTTPGLYEATITIGNCVLTKGVEVVENPVPSFSLGENISICKGDKVILQGPSQMADYSWSTGAKSQAIEISQAGNYWLEVTNESGCKTSESINVTIKQEPTLDLPTEIFACFGEKVKIDASYEGATYLWSNGQTTPEVEIVSPAVISLDLIVEGCTYKKVINVINEECLSIPNIITPNGDDKNDFFVIKGANPANIDVEIFNRWGISVYKKAGYDSNWSAQNLPAGVYHYVVKSSRSNKTFKGWVEVLH